MSTSYRRIDTTDPRRHDRIKPLVFPASWQDDSLDLYGFLLSSATMVSGMSMVTRMPIFAYVGLLFGLANYAHEKPHQAKKDAARNQAGPLMSMAFAVLSIVLITVQKLMGVVPMHQQVFSQNTAATKP